MILIKIGVSGRTLELALLKGDHLGELNECLVYCLGLLNAHMIDPGVLCRCANITFQGCDFGIGGIGDWFGLVVDEQGRGVGGLVGDPSNFFELLSPILSSKNKS